jgi:hypothetical protein
MNSGAKHNKNSDDRQHDDPMLARKNALLFACNRGFCRKSAHSNAVPCKQPEPVVNTELYQSIIMDHFRHPRHRGSELELQGWSTLNNPACGDIARIALVDSENTVPFSACSDRRAVRSPSHRVPSFAAPYRICPQNRHLSWVRSVLPGFQVPGECLDVEALPLEIQSLLAFSKGSRQASLRRTLLALCRECA